MTTPSLKHWLAAIPLLLLIFHAQAASLSTSSVTLTVGKSTSIQVKEIKGTASLSNANPEIVDATLSTSRSYGTIQLTGLNPGSAVLTLRDREGSKTVKVTVNPAMSVSPTSLSLTIEQTGIIKVSNPTGEIKVSSSNTEVASASVSDGNIKIEAKSKGTAILTIRDNYSTVTATVTVTSPTSNPPPPTSETPNGRLLASNCFQCHGTNGSGGVDKIMGESDLYGELQEYLNGGEDPNGIMAAHVKGYTPKQLQAIADYLANLQ